jgi:lysyl-tRNA synthetase class 2
VAAKLDLSNIADTEEDRDTLLQLLFTMGVEPHIGKDRPTFVYHFPASQASLAQISTEDHRVAERFEVYYKGIELANGFHELTDAREQQQRLSRITASVPRAVCRSSLSIQSAGSAESRSAGLLRRGAGR